MLLKEILRVLALPESESLCMDSYEDRKRLAEILTKHLLIFLTGGKMKERLK